MRAAAVQLNSTQDRDRNLATAERLTRAAAADGAAPGVLPERVDVRGGHDDYERHAAPVDRSPDGRVGAERSRASCGST